MPLRQVVDPRILGVRIISRGVAEGYDYFWPPRGSGVNIAV